MANKYVDCKGHDYEPIILPVITLWQPWAQFIMLGWKTIETRTHSKLKSLAHKTIVIHAGATWDKNWNKLAYQYMDDYQVQQTVKWSMFGKLKPQVLCSTEIHGHMQLDYTHSESAMIDCRDTVRYGLFCENIKKIPQKEVKGEMGIWYAEFDYQYNFIRKIIKHERNYTNKSSR